MKKKLSRDPDSLSDNNSDFSSGSDSSKGTSSLSDGGHLLDRNEFQKFILHL